ncbi:hypothetical protein IJG98_02470 [Candidatus Saccharibacteria bacterium]|nr:hypothetical protein [Candidatus Saccharibacteria bacterium]
MHENKQTSPSSRHRPFYQLPLFWIILIILVVAGILIVPRVLAKPAPEGTTTPISTTTTSSSNTSSTSSEAKSTTETAEESSSSTSDGKTPTKYDGEDPNTSASLTGSLTTARFSGDKLIVRVNIDQYLSSGTCTLTISSGSNQLVKTANLIPSAATSTCEGFDVPSSELSGFNRPLSVTINLTSGDKIGIIEGQVE